MWSLQLVAHREQAAKQPDHQVLFGVGRLLFSYEKLYAGEDQKSAEENYYPVILHQRRAQSHKDCAEHDRAENAVEQNPMLVFRGDAEVSEHHHKDKDVIDGQRFLDYIAGQKFDRDAPRRRMRIES